MSILMSLMCMTSLNLIMFTERANDLSNVFLILNFTHMIAIACAIILLLFPTKIIFIFIKGNFILFQVL